MYIVEFTYIFNLCRVQSRAIEICFDSPTVAPDNDIEQNSFDRLDEIINESELSTAIGWAISLRNQFVSGMSVIKGIRGQLRKESLFKGRRATNWSILLFFVKQVCIYDCACLNWCIMLINEENSFR